MCIVSIFLEFFFFFSSRRRHTRFDCDWSSDVCSSDLCASVPMSNIEIAQRAAMLPIGTLAHERLGIPQERLEPYGHYKAKVSLDYVEIGRASCRERV